MITLIAAITMDYGIGYQGNIPWYLPNDLAHFKQETLGGAMIMGRKTFESMPSNAFSGRHPVILSSGSPKKPYDFARDPAAALHKAQEKSLRVYIIGGAEVYNFFLPIADRILLTRVKYTGKVDTYFPVFNANEYRNSSHYYKGLFITEHFKN